MEVRKLTSTYASFVSGSRENEFHGLLTSVQNVNVTDPLSVGPFLQGRIMAIETGKPF
jgi:hypothetical protein